MKKATEKELEDIEREMKESAKQHVRMAVNPERQYAG